MKNTKLMRCSEDSWQMTNARSTVHYYANDPYSTQRQCEWLAYPSEWQNVLMFWEIVGTKDKQWH